MPLGSQPVPGDVERLALPPVQAAVVRPKSRLDRAGLPRSVTLGGPAATAEGLLLRFPPAWDGLRVEAAFLVLSPDPYADPSVEVVPVQVRRLAGAFRSGISTDSPTSRGPTGRGLAGTGTSAVLRLDVTPLLLEAGSGSRPRDFGVLVEASTTTTRGVTYLTGTTGSVPRLEVYGRRPPRAQATRD